MIIKNVAKIHKNRELKVIPVKNAVFFMRNGGNNYQEQGNTQTLKMRGT